MLTHIEGRFFVHDYVWMLVNKEGVIYCIETSPKELWKRAIEEEVMGTFTTKSDLERRGYRAKKVFIVSE